MANRKLISNAFVFLLLLCLGSQYCVADFSSNADAASDLNEVLSTIEHEFDTVTGRTAPAERPHSTFTGSLTQRFPKLAITSHILVKELDKPPDRFL